MAKPRPIKQLLATGTVPDLIAHARQLQSLSTALRRCLPADAASHVQVVHWSDGQLTVQVDSTAWATRLRYLSPQLLRQLQQLPEFTAAHRIALNIAPAATPAVTIAQPFHLSPAGARIIDANAETIADPQLRAALKRLARHGQKS